MDLNSDIGEGYGAFRGGPDEDLLTLISSGNVACGGHAGDPPTMRLTCRLAASRGVVIGAQVSYPDVLGFGRRFIDMVPSELADHVVAQVAALDAFARSAGARVRYVKPHGALYNALVHHERQAAAVADAVVECGGLPVVGLPVGALRTAADHRGLRYVVEGFADRAYAPDGTLVPRGQPGALIVDPHAAAAQALVLVDSGIESVCVHSDTPGSVQIAAAVRDALLAAGHAVGPFAAG
ncbi:MAG: LamB/YcsF family protein [Ilumatobacteraceae bacterium]